MGSDRLSLRLGWNIKATQATVMSDARQETVQRVAAGLQCNIPIGSDTFDGAYDATIDAMAN